MKKKLNKDKETKIKWKKRIMEKQKRAWKLPLKKEEIEKKQSYKYN